MTEGRGVGETALLLWRALAQRDMLYLADDEQEAEAVAAALGAMAPDRAVVYLPSSDTFPGDTAPASPANIGQRVRALRALRQLSLRAGSRVATIMSGEAAARLYAPPSAFDAAPPLLRRGDRIDMDGFAREIESIGYVVDDRVDEPGEVAVRGDVIDIFPADAGLPARIDVVERRVAAIRRYDPATQLSGEECGELEIGRAVEPDVGAGVSILIHLRPGGLICSVQAERRRRRFIRMATEAAGRNGATTDAVDERDWAAELGKWSRSDVGAEHVSPVPRFAEERSPLASMARFLQSLLQGRRFLLAGSERDLRFLRPRIERKLGITLQFVADVAEALTIPGTGALLDAPVDRGAICDDLVMVAAADLLGSRALVGDQPEPVSETLARSGGDIRCGDIVVHDDHGVGRVLGLEALPGDEMGELIALEYLGGARRLVPVREAGRIWRYGTDADAVRLDRLDGVTWETRRGAIEEAIAESVRALIALADDRARMAAPVIDPDAAAYERFVGTFPFNETAGQTRAIQAVRDDLASGRPMDRLVIGDVGFGKTEVALRAAALTALAGYQTVVAAPTTVLARQHLETFARRFAGTGVTVAGLSRLSGAAERKAVKAGLAEGSIHILVGTGAVMARDVRHARLGLVIIDEEQRFGVADKAKLRGRADVHLLAMSATPIPRTLHRAMIGLQQISVIGTPPARRQPVRTSLVELDDNRIRTALVRERSRGGQSFVVVPRIADLAPFSERLRRIVPDLALVMAHGKLPGQEIDAAMVGFAGGQGDVLLATNIIEAGLDIPRANTMIIWRADRFGLAQLHQLRGRVGRGRRRGQVMLLTDGGEIADRTMKRLRTLATYDRLGAGFDISAADLDQRGAGDPLSDDQAGHMKLIGIDLYQHLFEAALRRARGKDAALWLPEINMSGAGFLPPGWIPDADIRLGLYVRLARVRDEAELDTLEHELADRFGALPPPARALVLAGRITLLARASRISRIDAGPAAIALTPADPDASMPGGLKLVPKDGRWLLKQPTSDADRAERIIDLLERLVERTA